MKIHANAEAKSPVGNCCFALLSSPLVLVLLGAIAGSSGVTLFTRTLEPL